MSRGPCERLQEPLFPIFILKLTNYHHRPHPKGLAMTYRQLQEEMRAFTETELDQDVTIKGFDTDECFAVDGIDYAGLETNEDYGLDIGHPFLY